MNDIKLIKKKISKELKDILVKIKNIKSCTLVGSFNSSNKLESISDIDIIIIVDKLNEIEFDRILTSLNNFNLNIVGLEKYELIINSTFGPLKFDGHKKLVLHTMIYDFDGHKNHVEQSPFTCYDWENNKPLFGSHLKDVYQVGSVQLDDLISSRRGLENYLVDLNNKIISYRQYSFKNENYSVIKKNHLLDKKHINEYGFHIMKYILINLMKILTQKNIQPSLNEITNFYNGKYILFKPHLKLFKEIYSWKKNEGNKPIGIIPGVNDFLNSIFKLINEIKIKSNKIDFIRHAKTKLNNGTFLGIGRNPEIEKELQDSKEIYQIGFSSKMKRTIETLSSFKCNKTYESELLNEIDYGKCEGMTLQNLKNKYPEIIDDWSNGSDPRFPGGESQNDVLSRLKKFINKEISNKNMIIVTHLVVLRMLLKRTWSLRLRKCYLINISHLETLNYILYENVLIPNFNSLIRKKIRTNLQRDEF